MPLTRDRFEALADAYGGDLSAWPAEVQAEAEGLAAAESWARDVLTEAKSLDALLAASPAVTASAALTDRIVATVPRARRRLGWVWPTSLAAGLAAACAAGVIVGVQVSQAAIQEQSVSAALSDYEVSLDLEGDA